MNIKRLTTGTIMALTLMAVASPMINASASQDTNLETDNTTLSETYQEYKEEEYNDYIEEFQAQYGKEDKFNVVYEDEYEKEEINGATGDSKITDKETGEVSTFNYFKNLESQLDEEESYPESETSKMSYEQLTDYIKTEFQNEFGSEDEFTLMGEGDLSKEEINGATGEIKITDKETGKVTSYNLFDAMKNN